MYENHAEVFLRPALITSVYNSLDNVLSDIDDMEGQSEKKEVLALVYEEMNRLLKIGIQGFLALAASVGVSMSILFGRGESAWNRFDNVWRGVTMAIGFGMVGLGVTIWIIKPYLDNFTKVRYYYQASSRKRRLIL